MPTIQHECPNCQKSLESDDYMAGMPMTCPACEQSLRVPEQSTTRPAWPSVDGEDTAEVAPAAEETPVHTDDSTFFHAASPDLYRVNSFRIADLPVDASTREITRQLDKVKMLEKVGGELPPASGPLPLQPPPGAEKVREAVERLRDPEQRLVDEFFWFWPLPPGDSKSDPALAALIRSDAEQAARVWSESAQTGAAGSIARHNLAVLTHLQALDLETTADTDPRSGEALWSRAFQYWANLIDDDEFWATFAARIRDLNEPQLTEGTARRMRIRLPEVLLSINSALALRGAESGRFEEVTRHVALMKSSGLDPAAVEEALRRSVNPLRERIKVLGQTAESEADATPANGLEASRRLARESTPLLGVLDQMLGREHALCEGAHDEVALRMLGCQIPYANATEDWANSVELVKTAYEIAVSESARSRLKTNLDIVEANHRAGCCFFCLKNARKDGSHAVVPMYGNVTREPMFNGYRVRWQHLDVKVPRCDTCRAAHFRREKKVLLGGLLGGLLGFGGCAVVDQTTGQWFGALLLISLGMIIGGFIAGMIGVRQLPPEIHPESAKYKFDDVKRLRSEGWQYGTKPST